MQSTIKMLDFEKINYFIIGKAKGCIFHISKPFYNLSLQWKKMLIKELVRYLDELAACLSKGIFSIARNVPAISLQVSYFQRRKSFYFHNGPATKRESSCTPHGDHNNFKTRLNFTIENECKFRAILRNVKLCKTRETTGKEKTRQQPVSVLFDKIAIYEIFHYLRAIKCNETGKIFFLWWFICCRNFWLS